MSKITIGIDEAGMGTLAGPATAAVVALPSDLTIKGVRDSKKMNDDQREEVAGEIMDQALFYFITARTPIVVDQVGLGNAWQEMMVELGAAVGREFPNHEIIIDGNRLVTGFTNIVPIVKADDKYQSVSAASILAKYYQCCWMDDYEIKYPGYGFGQHRGYGTVLHKRALEEHGPCPIHRMSYKPIKKLLSR